MTHLRLWKFEVEAANEERFEAAYGPGGDWARLFGTSPGFIRTELWKAANGTYLTADHWRSQEDFENFKLTRGDEYHRLDEQLEGVAGIETFLGAADLVV